MNTHRIVSDAEHPAPLPLRERPYIDEDLLSLLRRSASRMGYPDVRWLLRPANGQWVLDEKEIPLLSAEGDYRTLGHLLQLSREEIPSHTLHRFAPFLEDGEDIQQSPGRNPVTTNLPQLFPIAREAHFLPIRFCPLCLQESEGYDRLYWRVRLLFHCPSHRVRLLEKCPSCGVPIAASRPSPYSCPRCQRGDYRMADAVPLSAENPLYLGERLLMDTLGFALPTNETASRSLASSPLPTLSGGSYLYLLKTVTSRLDTIFSRRELALLIHLLCAFSPEDSPLPAYLFLEKSMVVSFLFHWLFLTWPTHFSDFLDAWYSLSTPPFTGEHPEGLLSASRSLFYDRFEPGAYGWLRRVYHDYHQQYRQDPERIDHFRNSINRLAQSIRSPQEQAEIRRSGKDEERLFIPPRLLTPTIPYPWENLGSVLARAAKKMNHPYPNQLLYPPHYTPGSLSEYAKDEVPLFSGISQQKLAHLLQIPKEDIPRLTGSDLIRSLDLPRYNVFSRHALLTESRLRSWLLPHLQDTTRLCPDCVEEREGYDRMFLNLRGVLCCPHHRARLLEKCPACLQAIPAIRLQMNQCPFCSRATYRLSAKHVSKNSVFAAGADLLLMKLGIPLPEATSAFQFFGPSPLLEEKPSVYFALLIELTEEVGSYYGYSQEQQLQLCHLLAERTVPPAQTNDDPYVIDAGVVLFHTLFSRWPQRFFAFLDMLHQKALAPVRAPHDMYARWRWLLTNRWEFIAPDWLFDAFETHERR